MDDASRRIVDPAVCGASQGGHLQIPTASSRKRPSWKPESSVQQDDAKTSSSSSAPPSSSSSSASSTAGDNASAIGSSEVPRLVQELAQSERTYVERLNKLLSCYVQPLLLDSASQKPQLMSRQTISPLIIFFDSIELMREIHVNLLKHIDQRLRGDVHRAGAVFVADLFEQ